MANSAIELFGTGDKFTYYDPDLFPVAPSTEDDHFTAIGIDAKWTAFQTGAAVTHTQVGDHLFKVVHTTEGALALRGRFQAVAASDFTVAIKCGLIGIDADFSFIGLALFEDATGDPNNTNIITHNLFYQTGTIPCLLAAVHWSSYLASTATYYSNTADTAITDIYLRIRQNGTTLYFDYSTNGLGWIQVHSVARPWAPAEVGFVTRNTSGATANMYIDWFRYFDSDDWGPMGGVRTVG